MMMGKEETSLEPYIEKYTESRIRFFYSEYKKKISPHQECNIFARKLWIC